MSPWSPSRGRRLRTPIRRTIRARGRRWWADLGQHVVGFGYQRSLAPWISAHGGAPGGLWISPFAQAGVGFGLRGGERRTGSVWAAGASVGYTALLKRAVFLGLGMGVQYHAATIPGGDTPPRFSRFYPQVEIQLGYAF